MNYIVFNAMNYEVQKLVLGIFNIFSAYLIFWLLVRSCFKLNDIEASIRNVKFLI